MQLLEGAYTNSCTNYKIIHVQVPAQQQQGCPIDDCEEDEFDSDLTVKSESLASDFNSPPSVFEGIILHWLAASVVPSAMTRLLFSLRGELSFETWLIDGTSDNGTHGSSFGDVSGSAKLECSLAIIDKSGISHPLAVYVIAGECKLS